MSLRTPVGPQPPSVYWRRRAMVALGVIAVIVVIVLIVVRPGAGETDAATAPSTPPSEAPVASEEPATDEETADGACADRNLTIEAVVDKQAYTGGEQPGIGMTVTNVGTKPCTLDVSPARQVYEVGSGGESYWLSTDCQAESEPVEITLEPNSPLTTEPLLRWDRTRSAPCDSTAPVPAGDATYWLQVSLGELKSERATFRLL